MNVNEWENKTRRQLEMSLDVVLSGVLPNTVDEYLQFGMTGEEIDRIIKAKPDVVRQAILGKAHSNLRFVAGMLWSCRCDHWSRIARLEKEIADIKESLGITCGEKK